MQSIKRAMHTLALRWLVLACCVVSATLLILTEPREISQQTAIQKIDFQTVQVQFEPIDESPFINKTAPATSVKPGCPKGLIVSVGDGGRLGNQVWEAASAWAVAKMLNRTVYIPKRMISHLSQVFGNLSFTTSIEEIVKRCNLSMPKPIGRKEIFPLETLGQRYPSSHLTLPLYIVLHEAVFPYIEQFREEFRIRPKILNKARETIKKAGGNKYNFIGIHVRRTDFDSWLPKYFKSNLVSATYFKNAMQWYRDRLDGPVRFLVVSDDVKWCKANFADEKDVKIVSKKPAHDLAVMSLCNHTIIDYGTYGYTGAFLSRGSAITLDVAKPFADYMAKHAGWTVFSKETLKEA